MIIFRNIRLHELANLLTGENSIFGPYQVHLLNTYNIGLAEKNGSYFNLLSKKSPLVINLADGWPVSTFLTIRHLKKFPQIRGADLFRNLVKKDAAGKHFFLGSSQQNLEKMCTALLHEIPTISISGFYSPPYTSQIDDWIEEFIKEARKLNIDYLWVGLGTPKQDLALRMLGQHELDVKAIVAIGAAFDFISGNKPEASILIRKLKLEWLFRLRTEPNRLWKRYTLFQLYFLKAILLRHFI